MFTLDRTANERVLPVTYAGGAVLLIFATCTSGAGGTPGASDEWPRRRWDVVNKVHADGRVDATEHTADGTRVKARVPLPLAASLREFSTVLDEVVDLVGRSGHHSLRQLGFQLVEPLLLGFSTLLRTSEVDELIGDESVAQK